MAMWITRQLSIVYLIVIIHNSATTHDLRVDDSEPNTAVNETYHLFWREHVLADADGSGDTTTTSTMITTSTSTSLPLTTIQRNCNTSETLLSNGTCISINDAQTLWINIIQSNSSRSEEKIYALIDLFNSTYQLTTASNQSNRLTPGAVDELVDGLNNITITNLSTIFVLALPTTENNRTILGGLLANGGNNSIIDVDNESRIRNSSIVAAAVLRAKTGWNYTAIRLLILRDPGPYKNLDSSNQQSVVSPVIIASVGKRDQTASIDVSLYFQLVDDNSSYVNGRYMCAFFDHGSARWNGSGCGPPVYNTVFKRYECSCDHLTTFALIWLPTTPLSNELTPQDITSLVFLSISIVCFIAVIIHVLATRLLDPVASFAARDFLPLISSASTTILFIFYIALTMTVFTRTPIASSQPTPCFTSASVLMFITYFFLIFMFCAKTSIGYFSYLRFVLLFPNPSFRKLAILLLLSFSISIVCTAFAIGFNSSPYHHVTQIHGNKICWFTRDALWYFLTIPVGIFLVVNAVIIIYVAKRIMTHVRRATTRHGSYERMKQCIFVLLSSCVTQGIGWLFGPFLSFVSPTAGEVLSWFFIIFNGLEGVWTVLLYLIIRSQRHDRPKHMGEMRKFANKVPSKRTKQNDVSEGEFRHFPFQAVRPSNVSPDERSIRTY